MDKIIMLGTGHAMTFACFNTCFVYENEHGKMLVDTGGGNGLLRQLQEAGINSGDIEAVFISHRHTDHLMGLPWLLRTVGVSGGGKPLTIYLHQELMGIVPKLVEMLFPEKLEQMKSCVRYVLVQDGDEAEILGRRFRFMDLNSPTCPQFGFTMELAGGRKLAFCGDVPFDERNREAIAGADYLLHEAFNLESEHRGPKGGPGMPPMGGPPGGMPPMGAGGPPGGMPPIGPGGPGKMGHSTVKEAAGYAKSLNVNNLILFHGSDNDLENRQAAYTAEARQTFDGGIFVPYDLDVIDLT